MFEACMKHGWSIFWSNVEAFFKHFEAFEAFCNIFLKHFFESFFEALFEALFEACFVSFFEAVLETVFETFFEAPLSRKYWLFSQKWPQIKQISESFGYLFAENIQTLKSVFGLRRRGQIACEPII